MLMSPVFGLETDQSLEVEKQKEKYKFLKSKPKRNAKDKKQLSAISKELRQIPIQRSNSLLNPSDKKLLNDIKSAILKK